MRDKKKCHFSRTPSGKEEESKSRRKGDKNNVVIAARLRKETAMTLKWIAEHLVMGGWNNVSHLLAATHK